MTALFKWGKESGEPPGDAGDDRRLRSKVLPRFLAALSHHPAPVIIDLGPVVGSNIAFFGDRLACKIHVEDVAGQIESHVRKGDRDGMRSGLLAQHAAASVDGVLCWDVFDFLDRKTSQALAARLVAMLRPGGMLHGYFGTSVVELREYTRYFVDGEDALRGRPYPATPHRRQVLTLRDLERCFEGMAVAESLLLKASSREMLFRKLS